MNHMLKISAAAVAFAAVAGLAATPASFAKGHNQGATENPGVDVGSETVTNSQGEGAEQGNGKTASEASGRDTLGNSGNAGRGADND